MSTSCGTGANARACQFTYVRALTPVVTSAVSTATGAAEGAQGSRVRLEGLRLTPPVVLTTSTTAAAATTVAAGITSAVKDECCAPSGKNTASPPNECVVPALTAPLLRNRGAR